MIKKPTQAQRITALENIVKELQSKYVAIVKLLQSQDGERSGKLQKKTYGPFRGDTFRATSIPRTSSPSGSPSSSDQDVIVLSKTGDDATQDPPAVVTEEERDCCVPDKG